MSAAVTLTERAPSQRDLDLAESDLEWWHSLRESELGARGSGFESSGITWDDEAICRLIVQLFEPRRVVAVRRYARVAPILGALTGLQRAQSEWLYRSRPYPAHLRIAWHCDRNAPGVVTLVGAALRSSATRNAFARAHGGHMAGTVGELLDWADDATRPRMVTVRVREGDKMVARERPINELPHWAKAARDEATLIREELLTAYAIARRSGERSAYWV
jgi:hypothetical protein